MAARIRKGDKVVVITGKDKGRTGEVLRVLPAENRAVVQGINVARRHQRQTASNVALVDPRDNKPTRVGFRTAPDGRKVRYAKLSGDVIDG
jgi:large subunit ribosomal protein L24